MKSAGEGGRNCWQPYACRGNDDCVANGHGESSGFGSRYGIAAVPIAVSRSFCLLNLCHGVLPVHLFGVELDFVACFDGLEHCGVLRLVDHGHATLHPEPFGGAMLDRDLAGRLIDLDDLPIDQIGLRDRDLRSKGKRKRENQR